MAAPRTPLVTVDIIIEMADLAARPVVLIERRNEPLGWALPGGFVDIGESLEEAAVREAREETSLAVRLLALLGCYSAPKRDPRGHTVSAVYVAEASGRPKAADDARAVRLCVPPDFPPLTFDHGLILRDYLGFRADGRRPPPRL